MSDYDGSVYSISVTTKARGTQHLTHARPYSRRLPGLRRKAISNSRFGNAHSRDHSRLYIGSLYSRHRAVEFASAVFDLSKGESFQLRKHGSVILADQATPSVAEGAVTIRIHKLHA